MSFCLHRWHIFVSKCLFLKSWKEIDTHFTSILISLCLMVIEIITKNCVNTSEFLSYAWSLRFQTCYFYTYLRNYPIGPWKLSVLLASLSTSHYSWSWILNCAQLHSVSGVVENANIITRLCTTWVGAVRQTERVDNVSRGSERDRESAQREWGSVRETQLDRNDRCTPSGFITQAGNDHSCPFLSDLR
jgi:hypothetical protein